MSHPKKFQMEHYLLFFHSAECHLLSEERDQDTCGNSRTDNA